MLPGQGDAVAGHLIGAEKLRAQDRLVFESRWGKLSGSPKAGQASKHLLYACPYAIHKPLYQKRTTKIARILKGAPTHCVSTEQRLLDVAFQPRV
jgi:hypothetical protein